MSSPFQLIEIKTINKHCKTTHDDTCLLAVSCPNSSTGIVSEQTFTLLGKAMSSYFTVIMLETYSCCQIYKGPG